MPFLLMIVLAISFSAGPACAAKPASKATAKTGALVRMIDPAPKPEKKKPHPLWTMVPRDPGFCTPVTGHSSEPAYRKSHDRER